MMESSVTDLDLAKSDGLLVCSLCGQRLKYLSSLRQHEASHRRRFKCTQCPQTFHEYSDYLAHVKSKHQAPEPVRPSKRKRISAKFVRSSKLISSKVALVSKPISAQVIKIGLRQPRARPEMSNYYTNSCDICEKEFGDIHKLMRHWRVHTGERPFSCPVPNCPHRSTQKSHIAQHMNLVHTEQHAFTCSHCTASFKYIKNRERHELMHSEINSSGTETPQDKNIAENFDFAPSRKPTPVKETAPKYKHGPVDQYSDSNSNAKMKKYVCTYCDKKWFTYADLEDHIRTHTRERPFSCPELNCPFRCSHHSNISHHVNDVHLKQKKFNCSQCSASYNKLRYLSSHEVAHAENEARKSEMESETSSMPKQQQSQDDSDTESSDGVDSDEWSEPETDMPTLKAYFETDNGQPTFNGSRFTSF